MGGAAREWAWLGWSGKYMCGSGGGGGGVVGGVKNNLPSTLIT